MAVVAACMGVGTAQAQQAWTLRQCVDYAIAHNISVKQMQNTRELQALQLSTDKNSRLPDLNGSAAQNFSFGRGLTAQNTYENKSTSSTSFTIGSTVSLFDGFRTRNTIKLSQLNLDAADADLDKARNDLSMNVRMQGFVDNGKASVAQLAQQKATMAQSQLTVTTAANNYQMALLSLSQLLELPSPEGFSIVRPDIERITPAPGNIASPEAIFAEAMAVKPEVRAQQTRVEGADYNIQIAKAARYPQLNLNGGLGSNYYKTSGYEADGFAKQLKNNFSQYVGLSLSIPIFNRFATRNNIRRSEINRDTERLKLDDVRKSLYKEIQQVYYNARAAESKYASSREAVASNEEAFKLTQAKYENAKASITEFNEAKNNLLRAQSEQIQARYEYLYQTSLLNFYSGKALDF